MKKFSTLLVVIGVVVVASFAQSADLTRYVNPFIGTGGHGHTFPGATVPFGMVQLSPDTRVDNWDGSSGYHYSDSTIYGFSHTHLSGTGIPDYCDILFMPTLGAPVLEAKEGDKSVNGYASKFSHTNEKAEPGFYSVKLDDDGIFAEMTATARVGFHRYTFPKSDEANFILDLKWRDKLIGSDIKIAGTNRVEGYRRSQSWAKDQTIYFAAEFSKDFTVSAKHEDQAALSFKTNDGEKIMLKVAISPVSIEGARANLAAEISDWDFEKVRQNAKNAWNKELSQIEVSGGTDAQMTNFYSALYHTKIQPNIFQDVDGKYRGLDGKIYENPVQIQTVPNLRNSKSTKGKTPRSAPVTSTSSTQYTIFSLWDTFRAAHPLYTITDQKRTTDFINTFIRQYEQGGRLPVWELAGNETDCMIGYHSVSVIADAMMKGIKGFDYEKAFAAAKYSAELDHFGLEAYKRRGFISMEDENESVSKTLEYAYDDFCIAQMAKKLGKTDDHAKYIRRAQFYKNLFDAETGFMRPKQNGGFITPFKPNEVTFHFTEGNSWVYSFFVPHDVSGLMEMQGGKADFAKKLEQLFTTDEKLAGREQPDITGLIGQYAHGNEPSHHIAYLFNYAGQPWRTQEIVHKILDEFYKPQPDGLIGNEDCGQMSAWYVMSALGFYQVNPGQPMYALSSPIFRSAKIKLENGKTFTITASNADDVKKPRVKIAATNLRKYINSAKLNQKPYTRTYISHEDIMRGGTLAFSMSAEANKNFGVKDGEIPVSAISERRTPMIPVIKAEKRAFADTQKVEISAEKGMNVFFTIDGKTPTEKEFMYREPIFVTDTKTVKAIAISPDGGRSMIAEAKFYKYPFDRGLKLFSKYNSQYTGGGDEGLIDGIRGTLNFASGEWQGYQSQDFVAVIDLKKEVEIKKLGGGFLQNARSWIWMPTRIEFEVSKNNKDFKKIAEIRTDVKPEDMTSQIKDFTTTIKPTKTRYIRIKAYNFGKIPAWHPGAGGDAFIFIDEIIVE